MSSFDELWEGTTGGGSGQAKKERSGATSASGTRKSKQGGLSASANAWASVGLEVRPTLMASIVFSGWFFF